MGSQKNIPRKTLLTGQLQAMFNEQPSQMPNLTGSASNLSQTAGARKQTASLENSAAALTNSLSAINMMSRA